MLEPGIPWRLSDRVQRLVAPNPGAMTGPGTNTYLLGSAEFTVLDPGPAIDAHIEAIMTATGGRIASIVCTHTHPDHSPAWQALAERTGAEVFGALTEDDGHQDETFNPTVELSHDHRLHGDGFTLRALHTPGHVSNHYCFLLEEEGMLFAGDHIMNGSTVVIIPPGGDMHAYIASLELLLTCPLQRIAPGHGEVIEDSEAEIRHLVAHRLARESKVVDSLQRLGPANLDALVVAVYDDVDPALHPWAKKSLEAHLIKLVKEERAEVLEDGAWSLSSA